MTDFSGVQVVEEADCDVVAALMSDGYLPLGRAQWLLVDEAFPNSFVVFESDIGTALARVAPNGEKLLLVKDGMKAMGVKPKNQEQTLLMSTLLDDRIPVQVVAGRAGTGKTMLTLAAAMQKVEDGVYDKIILTKPMSQVGQYDLGILPGTVEDKFAPFLINYASNVEQLLNSPQRKKEASNKKGKSDRSAKPAPSLEQRFSGMQGMMAQFFQRYNVEMIPMQLLRGASLHKAFIIADEIQVLGYHEMLTLGTRVAEGSKLVLMGDLNQRDEKIARNATGLYKTIMHPAMKESPLVSFIELLTVERGPVAELFASVFEYHSS